MSNAKWRKLFEVLRSSNIFIPYSRWKLVDDPRIFVHFYFPDLHDLNEAGIRDGRLITISFADIELIEIPRSYPDHRGDAKRPLPELLQDLDAIQRALGQAGQFPLQMSDQALVIRGYEA